MDRALRCFAVTVLGLALAPGVARAATVNRDATTGVMTIVDDSGTATADDIVVERTSAHDRVTRAGGGPTTTSCTVTTEKTVDDTVECPRASSIAVDLGDGNDRFQAPTVTAPISVAGGAGNDDLATGNANDVLAGGPGNDTLDGGA